MLRKQKDERKATPGGPLKEFKIKDFCRLDPDGERTLFLGGIPLNLSQKEVGSYLLEIIDPKKIDHFSVMMKKRQKERDKNMGFGFLMLKSEEMLPEILQLRLEIEGKMLDIKQAQFSSQKKTINKASLRKRVVMLGLPQNMRDDGFQTFLTEYGLTFTRAYVVIDYIRQKSKQIGIVDLRREKDLKPLLKKRWLQLGRLVLEVRRYKPNASTKDLEEQFEKEREGGIVANRSHRVERQNFEIYSPERETPIEFESRARPQPRQMNPLYERREQLLADLELEIGSPGGAERREIEAGNPNQNEVGFVHKDLVFMAEIICQNHQVDNLRFNPCLSEEELEEWSSFGQRIELLDHPRQWLDKFD